MGKASKDAQQLSRRQSEVAAYVSQGLQNKEIATRMGVSTSTVKLHLRNACRKFGFRSRAQLAVFHTVRSKG